MGVGLHSDGHPDHHVLHDPGRRRDPFKPIDLDHRVQHHVTDAGFNGRGEFVDGFVVAVQCDSLSRKSGVQRDSQLTAAGDVERQTLLGDPASDLGAQERLGCVMHVVSAAEGRGHRSAPAAKVVLVDHEQRRSVLLGQSSHGDTGHPDHSVGAAAEVTRPDIRRQGRHLGGVSRSGRRPTPADLLGVPRPRRMDVHIRSGAEMPRILSPLAITWRVAAHSASRARCRSLAGSSPRGSTRWAS